MGFNRAFFENMGDLLTKYFGHYPCGVVTVAIQAYDQEYHMVRILECYEDLVTFVYYAPEKSRELPEKLEEKTGEPTAWPALTIPYSAILSVEFNPAKPETQKQIGFSTEPKS